MAQTTSVVVTSVLCFVSLCVSRAAAVSPCASVRTAVAWVPDPTNCQAMYICAYGAAIPLKCAPNLVWQPEKKVCCIKGSWLDTCTKKSVPKPKALKVGVEDKPKTCEPGMTEKLAHPKHCARYLDCAVTSTEIARGMAETKERECPFPKLFNSDIGDCDHYDNVTCGDKEVPKDACEYEMNKCHRSHCIPCFVRYASCKGLGDGKQIWKGRPNTPFFAECKNGRVMKHGRCKKQQLFHSEKRVCVDATTGLES